jgi:hypothetical protein
VPTDPNATQDPAQDPTEDNPADESLDTAPDTQGSSVDWEQKYREAQKLISKQGHELGIYRQSATESNEDDEEAEEEEPEPQPQRRDRSVESRLELESWQLAEQVYGEEALAAYTRSAPLLDRAVTPADYVAAFEAYHQARLGGVKPAKAAAAAQAQGEPPQPRMESNRPDEGPDQTQIDQRAEAAKAKGDSRGWIQTQLEKAGIR